LHVERGYSSKNDSISRTLGAPAARLKVPSLQSFRQPQAAFAEADFLPQRHQDTKKAKDE
jgi:hypothetical protein